MKNSVWLLGFLMLGLFMGCKKNDDRAPMEIALQNEPPLSFNLLDVPNDATEVNLTPTLSWESAENPKGSSISYDLYLGADLDPSTLYESDIVNTSFQLTNRLHVLTDYHWKVVARDVEGKMSQSAIHKFTTRNLNFPNEPVTASAGFLERAGHTSVVFDSKLWVIGGFDGSQKNDVWNSSHGETWTMVTASAQFSERTGNAVVVFDDKLWVIGGWSGSEGEMKNDVWYSKDGELWVQATANADFAPRSGHTAVVFDNKMWVIAGSENDFNQNNDVWYSSDGVNWTMATDVADFPARTSHTATVFDGKIWIIGGWVPFNKYNDIWYSNNGIDWIQTTTTGAFSARTNHTAVVFANDLWVIGGQDDQGTRKNDMWFSRDGSLWTKAIETAPFSPRSRHATVVFDDKIWVIGGYDGGYRDDVWAMD